MRYERINSNGARESNQMGHKAQTVAIWWGLRSIFPSLVALLVGTFILAAAYLTPNGEMRPSIWLGRYREMLLSNSAAIAPPATAPPATAPLATALPATAPLATALPATAPLATALPATAPLATALPATAPLATALPATTPSSCDVLSGRWVFDNTSFPLYKEGECRYMLDQLACGKFGRKDLKYQQWRWQPHGCDLPRFNATALLERLRNKRLMFVGDSLNRGQWVSLVCMVASSIPKERRSVSDHLNGSPLIVFSALDYNATIEFYWAPLLVESNCDDPMHHHLFNRIVRVRSIEKHARHWSDADVLVFDSYLWWRQEPTIKVSWESSVGLDEKNEKVKMRQAFKIALNTWSDWIEVHVNRSKTQVFFIGMSATHESAEDWGGIPNHNCFGETEPITKEGYRGRSSTRVMMHLLQKEINKLRKRGLNAHLLNITQLTEYRKDGHVSIHKRQTRDLTAQQLANPITYADCYHWCLPGVPDVWNELLYPYILQN